MFAIVIVLLIVILNVIYQQSRQRQLDVYWKYIQSVLDVCVLELNNQVTGTIVATTDNTYNLTRTAPSLNWLDERQAQFLINTVSRYRSLNFTPDKDNGNAYTVDKADIYFNPCTINCVNQFVLLHELSHIGTDSVGETQEFWENFKYMLFVAATYKIYAPIDFSQIELQFQNMTLIEQPLYVKQISAVNIEH